MAEVKTNEKIIKLREELSEMRFDIKSQNLESVADYRKKRKELARELTIKNEKSAGTTKKN